MLRKNQESAQAKACIMLLNIRIFAVRDDFFQPIPYLCLWGQNGILRPIGNRHVVDFSKASAGRLTIGRRLPTCPTFAAKPRCATQEAIATVAQAFSPIPLSFRLQKYST